MSDDLAKYFENVKYLKFIDERMRATQSYANFQAAFTFASFASFFFIISNFDGGRYFWALISASLIFNICLLLSSLTISNQVISYFQRRADQNILRNEASKNENYEKMSRLSKNTHHQVVIFNFLGLAVITLTITSSVIVGDRISTSNQKYDSTSGIEDNFGFNSTFYDQCVSVLSAYSRNSDYNLRVCHEYFLVKVLLNGGNIENFEMPEGVISCLNDVRFSERPDAYKLRFCHEQLNVDAQR